MYTCSRLECYDVADMLQCNKTAESTKHLLTLRQYSVHDKQYWQSVSSIRMCPSNKQNTLSKS